MPGFYIKIKNIFAEVLPVIVSITQGSDRDLEGLPYRVQSVLHHLCLMANSESVTESHTYTKYYHKVNNYLYLHLYTKHWHLACNRATNALPIYIKIIMCKRKVQEASMNLKWLFIEVYLAESNII